MRNLILIAFLVIMPYINAQTDSCKVLLEKITGKYTGECLNGLANGKGKSMGEDTYTGIFKDGLPNGVGKYVYKNGNIFQGNWLNGQKNGKGKFEIKINGKKNTITGYWEKDEYVGVSEPEISYKVNTSYGISDYKIVKNKPVNEFDNANDITFSIKFAFGDMIPSDLRIDKSSGEIVQFGKKIRITQYLSPLHCELDYSILVGLNIKRCLFSIDIIDKGKFTVTLIND